MVVEPKNYVSIYYTLTLDNGEVADSNVGAEPLGWIQGTGQVIEGLDKAIIGKGQGEKFTVTVPPEEAYGLASEDMFRELPRENFPEGIDLAPGLSFTARGPHGPVAFSIVEIKDDVVVADFNHALAGKTLKFDVEIVEVREPRAEELVAFSGGSSCSDDDCSSCGGGCGCN